MKIEIIGARVIVRKEESDKRFRSDSQFFYALRNALRAQGRDVIKKLMAKDGHMVSAGVYYIRDRKGAYAIHDQNYQIASAAEDFNKDGFVNLRLERLSA